MPQVQPTHTSAQANDRRANSPRGPGKGRFLDTDRKKQALFRWSDSASQMIHFDGLDCPQTTAVSQGTTCGCLFLDLLSASFVGWGSGVDTVFARHGLARQDSTEAWSPTPSAPGPRICCCALHELRFAPPSAAGRRHAPPPPGRRHDGGAGRESARFRCRPLADPVTWPWPNDLAT